MENGGGFQTQLVSIMESLARAALAEINRRVDDSCAVLRLEITQSQRDIDLLKNKCASMEGELKRTRMRARRKCFYPPTVVRCPPLVKVMLNQELEERDSTPPAWDRPMVVVEEIMQPPQCVELEHAGETGPIVIKEEIAEEDVWKIDSHNNIAGQPPCFEDTHPAGADVFADHYVSAENAANAGSLLSSAEGLDPFPEQRPGGGLQDDDVELLVKHEKEETESDKSTALVDSDHTFVLEEADRQLWSADPGRDAGEPNFLYGAEHYQQSSSIFACQSGLPMTHSIPEDIGPPLHSVGKSPPAVSAVRMKRRARTFGYKRPQTIHIPQEGQGTLTQINSTTSGGSLIPQSVQHQFTNSGPDMRNQNEGLMVPSLSASPYSGFSRAFSLGRRMRTPWRSGVGEKRFSCTYCTKSFMRFSQLKEHLRSHTGEKPFSCLQCGRSFTKQCNLIRHAVVHSGEKPYECALCGKCFTQRSSLKSHQKTAH